MLSALTPTKNRPADSTPAKDTTKVGHGWWQSIGQVGTEEKALDQELESLGFPGKQYRLVIAKVINLFKSITIMY